MTTPTEALTEANAALGFLIREARSNLIRDSADFSVFDIHANRVEQALNERWSLQKELRATLDLLGQTELELWEAKKTLDRQREMVHEANEALADERETLREIDRVRQGQSAMLSRIAEVLAAGNTSSQTRLLKITRIMEGTK